VFFPFRLTCGRVFFDDPMGYRFHVLFVEVLHYRRALGPLPCCVLEDAAKDFLSAINKLDLSFTYYICPYSFLHLSLFP